MSAQRHYDVVIEGGGPAGVTAAAALARRGRSVLLLEDERPAGPGLDWLSPPAVAALAELGVDGQARSDQRLACLTFVSEDFARHAAVLLDDVAVHVVNRPRLVSALTAAAEQAGATIRRGSAQAVEVGEDGVHGRDAEGREFAGRLTLLASGPQSAAARRLGLPRQVSGPPLLRAHACWPRRPDRGSRSDQAGLTVMLADATARVACLILQSPAEVSFSVLSDGPGEQLAGQFAAFVDRAARAGLLERPPGKAVPAPTVHTLMEVCALDMDTHVGKHGLLIGSAGGFVSPHSGEELWPAVHSALLAAQVADQTLDADMPQDALSAFDHLWRTRLAAGLGWPQTNLQLVLPLVFTNQPMAGRLAESLLVGRGL